MSEFKKMKASALRGVEAFNNGYDAWSANADKSYDPDCVYHSGLFEAHGMEDIKQMTAAYMKAFPDIHLKVEECVAEGNAVVLRYTVTGTFKGEFMGMPPTNEKITYPMMEVGHYVKGKVIEGWGVVDMTLLLQIGAKLEK